MRFIIIVLLILLCPVCVGFSLPPCTNQTAISELENIIESYQFRYSVAVDYFDCVDMAVANWQLLRAAGYRPKMALKKNPYGDNHCYTICPIRDGWVGIETALVNLTGRTGEIITDMEMWKILDTPEDIYCIDARGPPVIKFKVLGDVLEYVPKAPALPPLFAQ